MPEIPCSPRCMGPNVTNDWCNAVSMGCVAALLTETSDAKKHRRESLTALDRMTVVGWGSEILKGNKGAAMLIRYRAHQVRVLEARVAHRK